MTDGTRRIVGKAKAISLVLGGVATLAAAVGAHFRPETKARETAGAAAAAVRELRSEVRKRLRHAENAATAAGVTCRSEADSVRTLVLGWLLASRDRSSGSARTDGQVAKNLGEVVKQLGKAKAATLEPLIRAAPAKPKAVHRLEQISKGVE